MARAVWKFPFPMQDHFALDLPAGAKLLDVQVQHEHAQLWALCEPDAERERRYFRLAGTGHKIEGQQALAHVGSFQLLEGALVFHLFEVAPKG